MTTAFVLFAVVLCWYCTLHLDGRGRTDAAVAADAVHDSDSVQKSWVGGYAVFECPVPHDIRDPFVARWTKDGQTVFACSDGTTLTVVDERYDGRTSVVRRSEFGVAVNVSSLRESDAGVYECRIRGGGDPLRPSSPSSTALANPQTFPPQPVSSTEAVSVVGGNDGVRFRLEVNGGDILSIPPINQTRMEHESVHFSCVKEDSDSVVHWYKDGVPLDDLPSLNGRFHMTAEGSLDVYDAALNDNGFYSCRIVSAKGTLSAGAFLNVQYRAKVVYSPAEVYFAFGKPGTLDCHFQSNPPLTKIRWEKDGFLFDTYNVPGVYHKLNGSLYFDKVGKEHGGKYACTPFNDLGTEGPSTPMDVIVQHPPKLIIVPKVLYFRKPGENITMPCEAENPGDRGPAIVWQKADGKSLFDRRVTVTGGNLTLTGVRSEDRGVYRCVASNTAATISVETELIVEQNLFDRKHFDLHVNSTDRHIVVAYWKRPYPFCTVWSRDANGPVSSSWNVTATSTDGKAILWNLNAGREYEIMVSCRDETSGESLFSRSIQTRPTESDGRSAQDSRVSANPFDIRVERTGGNNTNNYNVSWTTAEIADVDATTSDDERNRLVKRRYVVKWYDAVDGKELGSTSTAANERYVVVSLAGGKSYGIQVSAITTADGRQSPVGGSRSFQTPASAAAAAVTAAASSSSTTFTKYYYFALFVSLVAGFVRLCCNNCRSADKGRRI